MEERWSSDGKSGTIVLFLEESQGRSVRDFVRVETLFERPMLDQYRDQSAEHIGIFHPFHTFQGEARKPVVVMDLLVDLLM